HDGLRCLLYFQQKPGLIKRSGSSYPLNHLLANPHHRGVLPSLFPVVGTSLPIVNLVRNQRHELIDLKSKWPSRQAVSNRKEDVDP
ncbi:MAG: hypothetical protein FWE89_05545, partial [Syntrophaceae bacterium]|nr:hypothetical protein [Syntrophaceae bacterium]